MYYAELAPNGDVKTIIRTLLPIIDSDNYIEIESEDNMYLSKRYDRNSKTFVDKPKVKVPYVESTDQEPQIQVPQYSEDTLAIMDAIADLYEAVTTT